MLHISTIFFQPVSQTYNYEVWSSYRRKYVGLLCSKEYIFKKMGRVIFRPRHWLAFLRKSFNRTLLRSMTRISYKSRVPVFETLLKIKWVQYSYRNIEQRQEGRRCFHRYFVPQLIIKELIFLVRNCWYKANQFISFFFSICRSYFLFRLIKFALSFCLVVLK